MIGSFWNLCRACPSMPLDKLHSEYRSTYRWHEYTGPRQDVVRRPPQPNTTAVVNGGEQTHEVQNSTQVHEEENQNECKSLKKVIENGHVVSYIMSPVPKLEPALPRRKKHPELAYRHHAFLATSKQSSVDIPDSTSTDRARDNSSGILRKALSKLSTEYRLQFAWPTGHVSRRDKDGSSTPKKSLSMGAIRPAANAMVHKKRTDLENKDVSELEPLFNDTAIHEEPQEDKVQGGRFTERPASTKFEETNHLDGVADNMNDPWYREVVELRKKAGQYKHRGWGLELANENLSGLYNKQYDVWDQVSQRSSLSALSLATTAPRSYTKEEKEQENNKRSIPFKTFRHADNSVKAVKDMIRHHLERTTGGTEFDGLILSPTREKLEPTIPRKDNDSKGSQKGSPQKGSPQKVSPQKFTSQRRNTQKAKDGLKSGRSQSVGPAETHSDKQGSKRQSRSATVKDKRPSSNTGSLTRTPRPSSLNTTASFRSKCSTVSPKSEDIRLAKAKTHKNQTNHYPNYLAINELHKSGKGAADSSPKSGRADTMETPYVSEPEPMNMEPMIKSPPEPTRVKSPEQIIVRSPDPVNWTVPLDTGKTFTVTQNIRNGEIGNRPHSEVKAWTPPDVPPPAALSAPPQFTEQKKEQGMSML